MAVPPREREEQVIYTFLSEIDDLYPPHFVIVNGNFFFSFASFEQFWTMKYTGLVEVMIESDRGSKKSAG